MMMMTILLACLLPATGLVHAFAVLSDGVRAARLVILKHILQIGQDNNKKKSIIIVYIVMVVIMNIARFRGT